MKPLHYYLAGTGAWFLAFGIQSVLFAWLVTIVLRESPEMVGFAQMCMLVPSMLLMLFGGVVADHFGGRVVARAAQAAAVVPVVALGVAVASGSFSFSVLIAYALIMGMIVAFVTPSRDGLLNQVAQGRVQRTVVITSIVQFAAQMVGFGIASIADRIGAAPVIAVQAAALLLGAAAYHRVQVPGASATGRLDARAVVTAVVDGARTVLSSPPMRAVMIMNIAMGLLFMGSFIVTLPLAVREVYGGSSADLGVMNVCNSLGLLSTLLVLLQIGDLARPGRALLLSQAMGAAALAAAGSGVSFPWFLTLIFFWGTGGGVTMSMSRSIMQELAPEDQRGRVMAFFSFTFMGAGPVGALVNGTLVGWFGAEATLMMASAAMLVTAAVVALSTSLWGMRRSHQSVHAEQISAA